MGLFLKLMIADKAGVVVDAVFDHCRSYGGAYYLVAGVLYSIQLYTDFSACVCMARGTAEMFGIALTKNFDHPYFAVSVRDFWRRWHQTLSAWLRDYIYIPLGGNRKGRLRRYLNLILTYLVSGLWHGVAWSFLFWGLLHAFYQIAGELLGSVRLRLRRFSGIDAHSAVLLYFQRIFTFGLVTAGWIIFRADTLQNGLHMLKSILTDYNPWIFLDGSLLRLGLVWQEWALLLLSLLLLYRISRAQTHGSVRDALAKRAPAAQLGLCLAALLAILVFGTYGFGFDAGSFIYGGF